MTNTEAGPGAGTDPVRTAATREVSPAARKLAEAIARRLAPKLERTAQAPKATNDTQQTTGLLDE
jgi:hypothetical protein